MAVYAMVGFLAVREVIGIGNVLMISSAVTMLIAALSNLAQIITDLRNNNVHLLNYFKYMDLEEEARGQSGAVKAKKAHECQGQSEIEIGGNESGNGNVSEGRKGRSDEVKRENIKGQKRERKCDGKETLEFTLEGVSFSYPGSKERVLRNINLRIAPGEKLAGAHYRGGQRGRME